MGWSLLSNALRPFKIYCATPNLSITRTWICWLNFVQMPIFSGLRFFNKPKSQTRGPQLKVPPGGLALRIFTSWKNPLASARFEPANLGIRGEHVTSRPPTITTKLAYSVPRHHRPVPPPKNQRKVLIYQFFFSLFKKSTLAFYGCSHQRSHSFYKFMQSFLFQGSPRLS